ncbi:MAG: hypothetical protein K2O03_01300, partial [Lachnospiraceae bacterium]|nr:hypothetical protein [Lachnospiraceae bacterium]
MRQKAESTYISGLFPSFFRLVLLYSRLTKRLVKIHKVGSPQLEDGCPINRNLLFNITHLEANFHPQNIY